MTDCLVRAQLALTSFYEYDDICKWNVWKSTSASSFKYQEKMFLGKCFTNASNAAILYPDEIEYYDGYYASLHGDTKHKFMIFPHAWLVEKSTGKLIDLTYKTEEGTVGVYLGCLAKYDWIANNDLWKRLDRDLSFDPKYHPYMIFFRYKILKEKYELITYSSLTGIETDVPKYIAFMKEIKATKCDYCHIDSCYPKVDLKRCSKCKSNVLFC